MREIDKIDMLWIRACKSADPITRLLSVQRRFYYQSEITWVAGHLVDIVDTFFPISALKLSNELSPGSSWKYSDNYNQKLVEIFCSHIRLTPVKDMPDGFIKPIRFRRTHARNN